MSTMSLLAEVASLSDLNRSLAENLINQLRDELLLDGAIVGSDGTDGISIRWPDCKLFCDVTDQEIYISVVPNEPAKLEDLKFDIYRHIQVREACGKIANMLTKT